MYYVVVLSGMMVVIRSLVVIKLVVDVYVVTVLGRVFLNCAHFFVGERLVSI